MGLTFVKGAVAAVAFVVCDLPNLVKGCLGADILSALIRPRRALSLFSDSLRLQVKQTSLLKD